MLSIIVAKAKNNVIGKDNELIWHLSDDLKRFKKLTTGHTIIMGRKTFESLGRVLPNRHHIVLTHNSNLNIDNKNVEVIDTIDKLSTLIENQEENFVIGGGAIYKLLLPYCKRLYVTELDQNFEGDVTFPVIDKDIWQEIKREKGPIDEKNKFNYYYVIYERKI